MLLNLTQELCVSRHISSDSERWICYTPCPSANNKKRVTWQKISGLLSTEGMQNWLNSRYPDGCQARRFSEMIAG